MKKILSLLFIGFLLLPGPLLAQKGDGEVQSQTSRAPYENSNLVPPVNAQDSSNNNEVDTTQEVGSDAVLNSPFDVNIVVGTQSAWDKSLPIDIYVTPKIDATRTQILFDTRYGISYRYSFKEFFPMRKGETQVFRAYVLPDEPGTYSINVNVTDWGYGKNYTSSDSISVTFDHELITSPVTDGYQQGQILRYVIIGTGVIIFIVVLIFIARSGIKWLKEWLKPPQ